VLTEVHYAVIGRVAVAASELEHQVIMLLVVKRGNEGDQTAMAAQNNSKWRRELRQLARQDATEHAQAVTRWLDDVEQLLDRRHALMHSRWFRDGSSAIRSPIGMRASRDKSTGVGRLTPIAVDVPAWSQLADALEQSSRQVWPLAREEMRRCGLT
jgi:hypothetical protein